VTRVEVPPAVISLLGIEAFAAHFNLQDEITRE